MIIVICVLIMSAVIHEVSHAYTAYIFGDATAKYEGRLTLNPFKHLDLFWSILLPAMLILSHSPFLLAGAKPVPINPNNFYSRRKGILWVSFAGPLSNFFLAVIFSIIFYILLITGLNLSFLNTILQNAIVINIILGVFNLVPIPPLDGSKILMCLLPRKYELTFYNLERYGFIILILALSLNLFSLVIKIVALPIINFLWISG